jgi:hypothetical protein
MIKIIAKKDICTWNMKMCRRGKKALFQLCRGAVSFRVTAIRSARDSSQSDQMRKYRPKNCHIFVTLNVYLKLLPWKKGSKNIWATSETNITKTSENSPNLVTLTPANFFFLESLCSGECLLRRCSHLDVEAPSRLAWFWWIVAERKDFCWLRSWRLPRKVAVSNLRMFMCK